MYSLDECKAITLISETLYFQRKKIHFEICPMDLVIAVTFFRPTPTKYYELTPIIINSIRQVATYHTRRANTRYHTYS